MATLEERLREVEALNAQDFINPSPEPKPQMAQPGPVRQVEEPLPGQQMQPQGPTLESRLSEVMEALQQDARPVQADLGSKEHNAVLNYLGAFNNKVAEALAAPPELINEILSLIGIGAFKPGAMREANREAFRRAGINVDAIDGLSKELGEATFTSLAMYGSMIAAAPSMAAKSGSKVLDVIIRTTGEALKKHPWLAAIEEAGATVGGVLASRASGENPLATMGGAMAGAITAGGTAKRTLGLANRIAAKFRSSPPGPNTAIRDPNAAPEDLPQYAEDQINGDLLILQRAIDDAIMNVPTTGSARKAQEILRGNLDYAFNLGRQIEAKFWDQVPLKEPVPMSSIHRNVENMKQELLEANRFGKNVPTKEMEELLTIGRPFRDEKTGRMVKDLPTVEQLRNKSREFKIEAAREEALDKPDYQRIGYLKRLSSIVDEGITEAFPNDVSIRQAREFSIKFNDLFTRGPIADVRRTRASGANRVPEGMTAEQLLKSYDGVLSVRNIAKELRDVRVKGRRTLDPVDRQFLDGMESQMEQTIRNMFREAATNPDGTPNPDLAAKWLRTHEEGIKPLAKVAAELRRTVDVTQALMQEQREIAKSSLAKFAQMSPEKAISSIWTAKDPVRRVREIRAGLSNEPRALHGLSNGMIDELFRRGRNDVLSIASLMKDHTVRKMLEASVEPDALRRLDRVVAIAQKFASGDAKTMRQVLQPGISILARILGAHLGRSIAPGQLQAPSIMSQNAMRLAEGIFGSSDASTLLRLAVTDPKWEKILLQRLPSNTREMKTLARRIGALVGAKEVIRDKLDE